MAERRRKENPKDRQVVARLTTREYETFMRICEKAGVKPSDIVRTFISGINKSYKNSPQDIAEITDDLFTECYDTKVWYKLDPNTGNIVEMALGEDGVEHDHGEEGMDADFAREMHESLGEAIRKYESWRKHKTVKRKKHRK